jgi:predicted secreted Zn-dependent protease
MKNKKLVTSLFGILGETLNDLNKELNKKPKKARKPKKKKE